MSTREVLQRLLAATPSPPPDADAGALLTLLAEALPARQAILGELGAGRSLASAEERALADEIFARQSAWTAALTRARDHLGRARVGAAKLRNYALAAG